MQIVGGTLTSDGTQAESNFESDASPSDFAKRYRELDLPGGHVISLGPGNRAAAMEALKAYPGGMHFGGGVTPGNASDFLDAGASHVIVTSYAFRDGVVDYKRLDELVKVVGSKRLVLDLSCRFRDERVLGGDRQMVAFYGARRVCRDARRIVEVLRRVSSSWSRCGREDEWNRRAAGSAAWRVFADSRYLCRRGSAIRRFGFSRRPR